MPNLFRSYIKKREEAIKADWEDLKNLSIKTKKILLIFIIQNISAFLFAILDKDLPVFPLIGYGFLICFCFSIVNLTSNDVGKWTRYSLYSYSIVIPIAFLCSTHLTIFHNWDKNYSELISFSGETFKPKKGDFCEYDDRDMSPSGKSGRRNREKCVPNPHFLYIQSKNKKLRFSCSKTAEYYFCDELKDYFNKNNQDLKDVSVKYAIQQKYFNQDFPVLIFRGLTFFSEHLSFVDFSQLKQNVIYEISHQGKVIYDYEYFIQKYRQQRIKHAIYMIYLVLNSIVFIFIYRSFFQKAKTYK